MRLYTLNNIHGERMLQAMVIRLIKASIEFTVIPLVEDEWEIQVKEEHGKMVEQWRIAFLEDKGMPSYDHLIDVLECSVRMINEPSLCDTQEEVWDRMWDQINHAIKMGKSIE